MNNRFWAALLAAMLWAAPVTAADITTWSTSAASNNSAAPDGFPEGMAPSAVNDAAREVMAAVRRQTEDAEWFNWGDTTTYASATSFTVAGDVTSRYHVNRRVRAVGTLTGTIYGRITASSFSASTTVTVEWDSGSLQSETLTVSLATLSADNPSVDYRAVSGLSSLGTAAFTDSTAYEPALPAGSIVLTARTTAATGYLMADGSAVSRTTYADLFTAIGTTYGAGDGSTTFNLPDLRGRMPIGVGTGSGLTARALADTGGDESVALTVDNLPSGNIGSLNLPRKFGSNQGGSEGWGIDSGNAGNHTNNVASSGSDTPHENMPPFIVLNFMIKT